VLSDNRNIVDNFDILLNVAALLSQLANFAEEHPHLSGESFAEFVEVLRNNCEYAPQQI
jgi:hypothetical protein